MILGFLLSPSSLHYVQGDFRELDWTIKSEKEKKKFIYEQWTETLGKVRDNHYNETKLLKEKVYS